MNIEEIGKRMRESRKARGLTLEAVALASGLSRVTLGQIETNQISEVGVRKLMRALEVVGLELSVKPLTPMPTLDDLNEWAEDEGRPDQPRLDSPQFTF